MTPLCNHPRIAALLGDSATEYLVVCEQREFTVVSSLETALYVVFPFTAYSTLRKQSGCIFFARLHSGAT